MEENKNVEVGEKGSSASKADNKTIMGVLAYIGPLVIVSYLMAKDDPFVKFHIKQGLILVVIEILIWILGSMFWHFWEVIQLLNLAVIILSIIGIVNVVQKQQKELPVVGQFSKYFTF